MADLNQFPPHLRDVEHADTTRRSRDTIAVLRAQADRLAAALHATGLTSAEVEAIRYGTTEGS
ncbi:hypothetical protein GCM10025865_01030 [Paraoerskovia sediminicola]|uniref:Uncharacterized protein n=1 Tax=Paraoerskovia sediminicola TaxID=1138587 RepID=A0ABM8FYH4_9CELL|nr:hypothetical protein [Paraoerskovia sediminicola]BDZ40804.1 hypothetical protein GCM10025865_01030 [Paraoerskovia sediminicola]